MLTVEQAQRAILDSIQPLPPARFQLHESLGLALAEQILADIDMPPFDNSAVDGYAVLAADTAGATTENPAVLREIPGVVAGGVAMEAVTAGTCARVMTGAPMPPGADAMVMREDARETDEGVAILTPAVTGDHIRRQGENVRAGTPVLESGTLIGAAEIGVLAMMGAADPLCHPRPRVAVLSTGDELVAPDQMPGPGQIRDSNRFALAALVAESGAALHSSQHVPDSLDATVAALVAASGAESPLPPFPPSPVLLPPADVIVTSGGVSVGDRDFIKPALETIGRLEVWRVSMKPGKPLAFGRIARPDGGETLFFGLPGNPVSTMVTFELFVRTALWRLAGRRDLFRPRITVRLTHAIDRHPGRQEFIRATAAYSQGRWIATPTGAQGSANLASMLGANALIVVPADQTVVKAGDVAEALLIGTLPAVPH